MNAHLLVLRVLVNDKSRIRCVGEHACLCSEQLASCCWEVFVHAVPQLLHNFEHCDEHNELPTCASIQNNAVIGQNQSMKPTMVK